MEQVTLPQAMGPVRGGHSILIDGQSTGGLTIEPMERAVRHWAKVPAVAVAISVLVTALAVAFPDPVKTATDVFGPVLFLGACIATFLGLGILWNEYWGRAVAPAMIASPKRALDRGRCRGDIPGH